MQARVRNFGVLLSVAILSCPMLQLCSKLRPCIFHEIDGGNDASSTPAGVWLSNRARSRRPIAPCRHRKPGVLKPTSCALRGVCVCVPNLTSSAVGRRT